MIDIDPFYFFDHSPYTRLILSYNEAKGFVIERCNDVFYRDFDIAKNKKMPMSFDEIEAIDNMDSIISYLKEAYDDEHPKNIEVKKLDDRSIRYYVMICEHLPAKNKKAMQVIFYPDPIKYSILKQERDDAQILFNSIFQTIDAGMIVVDHHRRVVRVNDSFLENFGWDAQDLIGVDFSTIYPPANKAQAIENHTQALRGQTMEIMEAEIYKGDGELADVLSSSAMMEMTQKRRFQMIAFINISERKKMEQSLRIATEEAISANKAKSDFLANMSHELRTPLNAIIGFSEMMINGIFGPIENERYRDYLEDVHTSARHLLAIINDVLDMSKIEAGRLELDERVIDPASLVNTISRIMAGRATSQHLNIIVEAPEDLPRIKGDERLIRQILMNLLANAIKFTPKRKNIYVKVVYNEGENLCFIVEDEGVGIPSEHLNTVLEPFGQVADPSRNNGQGTGLGLPLARAMMELHGGLLQLDSQEGLGTTVRCCFPPERIVEK